MHQVEIEQIYYYSTTCAIVRKTLFFLPYKTKSAREKKNLKTFTFFFLYQKILLVAMKVNQAELTAVILPSKKEHFTKF